MLGEKRLVPKLVYRFTLEERVPVDHLLRRVAAAVDFSFVRRLTARFYSHLGQPGIDPVVLFKMALLGYLYGITSERRLAEAIQLNLAFMWFIGYDIDERTPDHSVLSKARQRFGVTTYRAFFTEIVRQCEQVGLVQGNRLYVDSTLVKANASMASVGARTLVEQQLAGVDEHVAALWRDNPESEPVTSVEGRPTNVVSLPSAAQPMATETTVPPVPPENDAHSIGNSALPTCSGPHPLGPDDLPNGRQGGVNELAASRSDPDAGLVSRDDVPLAFYHKAHVGVDGGAARIITAIEVTAGEVADEHLLDRVRKEHAGTTGRTVVEVIADTKYGTQENYLALEHATIWPSIPPHDSWDQRALPRDMFQYEPGHDRFRCPEGQILARQGRSQTGGGALGVMIYRASPKVCAACPLKATCCGDAKARTVSRPEDGGLGERVRTYLHTGHAKTSIRRRKCWAESAMAELKERHGLRRARCRGRANVQIEALGAAIAYNIKKLARWPMARLGAPAKCAQHPAVDTVERCRTAGARPCRRARTPHAGRTRLLVARNPQNTARHPDFGNRPPWNDLAVSVGIFRARHGLAALDPYLLSLRVLVERFCFEIGDHPDGGLLVAEKRSPTLDHGLDLAWLDLRISGTRFLPAAKIERRIRGLTTRHKRENIAGLQRTDRIVSPIGRFVLGKPVKEDFRIIEAKFRRIKGSNRGPGLVVLPAE